MIYDEGERGVSNFMIFWTRGGRRVKPISDFC